MFELKKIGFVKRASACLLDAILLAVLTAFFMYIVSLICNYSDNEKLANEYYAQWEDFRADYMEDMAEAYGFDYKIDEHKEITITKDGEAKSLNDVINALLEDDDRSSHAGMEEAYKAYKALPSVEKVNWQYKYVYTLLFMMVSVGVLLAYLILEFVLPIIFKNGQTVGKKVFGICLVRPNCVKITNMALFARSFIGKFAIETMFPILLVFLFLFGGMGLLAVILFAALALFNIVLFFTTKNRTPIHDLLAGTVTVDMKLQMIYASEEELAEKKALAERENSENAKNKRFL